MSSNDLQEVKGNIYVFSLMSFSILEKKRGRTVLVSSSHKNIFFNKSLFEFLRTLRLLLLQNLHNYRKHNFNIGSFSDNQLE